MKANTRKALAEIRRKLGLHRINPRRLFIVDDGAYTWIGDRADLNAADARDLRAISAVGGDPASASREERERCAAADYDSVCSRCSCVAATHGAAGVVSWDDLPGSWRDGSALGPISPL